MVLGYGFIALRGLISIKLITIIFANFLIILGPTFIYIGIMRFLNQKENRSIVVSIFAVFLLSFFYYTYFDDNITLRTVIVYAVAGFFSLLTAQSLFFYKTRFITTSAYFNGSLLLIYGCFFAFRALETLTIDPVHGLFTPTMMQTVSFLILFIYGILLTFGLIIMVNQRLNAENREAKENLEMIFNTSPDSVLVTRLMDGYFVDINDGFTALTGYTRAEVMGKSSLDINLWENPADRQQFITALTKKGFCENLEAVFQRKNGSQFNAMISAKIISLKGAPHIISVTRDISARKHAEQALRESEEKHRLLIENSHDIIYTLTTDGVFTFVSPAWTVLLGHQVTQVVGHAFQPFVHPDDLPGCMAWLQKVIETGQRQEGVEYRVRHLNGSWFWHTSSAVPLRDETGRVIGFEGTARDITERKVAENWLTQTHQNYETFFNTIDEFLFVLDEQGNIIHTNTTVTDRLGYTEEELLGKSVLLIHPPERRDEAGRIVGEMLKGSTEFCPVPVITKSGVQIPVETRVSHGFWDGKPVIFGVTKDISEIRLSEEKFSKLFHLNPSACGLSGLDDHKYIEVNEAFYTLLGFDKNEVIGKTAMELGISTIETLNAISLKADSNGNVTNIEADLKAKNGEIKHVLLSSENIYLQDKKYRFTVVNDITERKEAEVVRAEFENQNRQLQKSESLARMAGSIAHHFNNQLGVVIGNLELAVMKIPKGANTHGNLTSAMEASNKAAQISGLMLTYLGQSFDKREQLNLSDACRMNLPILKATMPGNVVMETDLPSPGPAINTNTKYIQQILTNLVTNAREAVGQSQGTISLSVKTVSTEEIPAMHHFPLDWQPQDNIYACLEVTDTGCGIADEDMEKLCDPFFTRKFTGRGMGLAVVLGLVRVHNGVLTVESQPDKGTTFRVFLQVSEK